MLIRNNDAKPIVSNSRRQLGFTLIEAMVAVVVFSIALIGLAAMYNKSVQVSHSAYLRSLASVQALSATEMARLAVAENRLANSGEIVGLDWATTPASYSCSSTDAPNTGSGVLDGNVDLDGDGANEGLSAWCSNLSNLYGSLLAEPTSVTLQLVDAGMTGSSDDYVDVAVSVSWTERGAPTGAEDVTFTYEARVQ